MTSGKAIFILIGALFLILATIFVFTGEILAKNTASISDCQITITTYIAFYTTSDYIGINSWVTDDIYDVTDEKLIKSWEKGAEDNLNGSGRTFGECKCSVKFDIVTQYVKEKGDCPKDYHCVEVSKIPKGTWHTSNAELSAWDPKTKTSSSGSGEWDSEDTPEVAAHEIGHLLGLDDEYGYDKDGKYVNKNPQPKGSPPNKMAQTWDNPAFLQSQIDKIINDAGIKCPDKCCCGNGKVEKDKGEECEPPGLTAIFEHVCGYYEKACNEDCKWLGRPSTCCGDGQIQKPNDFRLVEECEKDADCGENQICKDCKCQIPARPVYCGDGYVSLPYEECEKDADCGENQICKDCKCQIPARPVYCGDGYVDPSYEECDPGNLEKGISAVPCEMGECVNCKCVHPPIADAALTDAKDAADLLAEEDYTEATWAVLEAALALPETTNAEVLAKTTAISDAIDALVFAGQAALDAAVAESAELTAEDYTLATWVVLTDALALPETTNAEVVAKTTAINDAIAHLIKVELMPH